MTTAETPAAAELLINQSASIIGGVRGGNAIIELIPAAAAVAAPPEHESRSDNDATSSVPIEEIILFGKGAPAEEGEEEEDVQPSASKQISNRVFSRRMAPESSEILTKTVKSSEEDAAAAAPSLSSSPTRSAPETTPTKATTMAVPQSATKFKPIAVPEQSEDEIISNSLSDKEWRNILSHSAAVEAAITTRPPPPTRTTKANRKDSQADVPKSSSSSVVESQVLAAEKAFRERQKEHRKRLIPGSIQSQDGHDGVLMKKLTRFVLSNSPMVIDIMQQFQEDFFDAR